ncbi:MAG: hypothetical protein J6Y94_02540, partial [Bacteriovoracaceae bacterium]|nr:hypothetical protein [Bacteriovoracaceae bacterium]
KNLAKTFVLNEAWLAARLPRIFNLYLQEMAVRLKQAGFPVQYYLPDNASEETTASLLIPVTLSYVPGADGPTSVASGPTYRFNFDLAKIKGREFAPLREFFQQVFTYAPDLAQIIDSLAWLKKINYFNLMIQAMKGCIMKNAQTHEFKYRARSKGVGGNIPGSYYYVNVDPSELWINPYLAGGTLAHEFHHAMKANSNEDFFFRLDDEGVIFNDLVGSGYDDHFSSDEIPARIDELKYYRQLAEKFQKEQNLPPEFNSHVPANFKQQKDLALKMLQDARILLQEALAELERNPESLELGQVGHPYMILNFHSSLISDTTKKVHLKLAKTAAFGLNGTTIDVQRLTYQYLPDTEFPGVDKESDTYFDLIDEVYRQFAQNPPAPYFEQFVQGMKIALAHGLELLEQYEAELRPIQLPKINNDHAWVKKFLGQN